MDVSVDDIHHEAHQIIDQLQSNLKEMQRVDLPTIVQENESMDNLITNNDILGPLIERQRKHDHDQKDLEKQKKILEKAKAKWSEKYEDMVANTDQWFINEDGDIVLIYPEADNVDNKQNKNEIQNQNKQNDVDIIPDLNDNKDDNNNNNNEDEQDIKTMEVTNENEADRTNEITTEIKEDDNVNIKDEDIEQDKHPLIEDNNKHTENNNANKNQNKNDSIVDNDNNVNDNNNNKDKKTETFFNSWRFY